MNLDQNQVEVSPKLIQTGNARYTKEIDEDILRSIRNHGRPDAAIYMQLCNRYGLRYSQVTCRYNALRHSRSVKTYKSFKSGNTIVPNDIPDLLPDSKEPITKSEMENNDNNDSASKVMNKLSALNFNDEDDPSIYIMVNNLLAFDSVNYMNGSNELLSPNLRKELLTFKNN